MAENELEKEIKQIKKDLENINKKIDLVIEQTKEKDTDSGTGGMFKDSYQLFFGGIFGAVSAYLVTIYLATPTYLNALELIAILFVLAIIIVSIIRFTFRNPKRKTQGLPEAERLRETCFTKNHRPVVSSSHKIRIVRVPMSLG
jgi:Flp pilus assembly protein TadB